MKTTTKFRIQGGLKMVSALLEQGWIFENLNENFATMSFEIDDSENKEIVECFCKEPGDTTRCFHEGPCSPKGSDLAGLHCRLCAGWEGDHKPGCLGEPLYKIVISR